MGNNPTVKRILMVTAGMKPQDIINSEKANELQKKLAYVFDADGIEGYSQREADVFNATLITDRGAKGISLFTRYQDGSIKETKHSANLDSFKFAPGGEVKPYEICTCPMCKLGITLDGNKTNNPVSNPHNDPAIKELLLEFMDSKESQVKNKNWTGDKYLVKKQDNLIKVLNCKTYKKTEIDLEKLTEELSWAQKKIVKKFIKGLPGEVLEDISNELQHIIHNEYKNAGGVFDYSKESLALSTITGTSTFTHELGHAVDCMSNGKCMSHDDEFQEIFESELQAFIAAGHKQCGYTYDWDKKKYKFTGNIYSNYCTCNTREMFAECYRLLMTGSCGSKRCILKYFPNTLMAVKQQLECIRTKSKSERCSL